jgi:transposase-like protein
MRQKRTRRTFTSAERIQIVLEGMQDGASVSEVCRRHQISPTLFYRWQKLLVENADRVFVKRDRNGLEQQQAAHEAETARLNAVIAELTAENLALKKTPGGWKTGPEWPRTSGR